MQNVATSSEKAITFFIGGAGDKVPYLGWGPTGIMQQVQEIFSKNMQGLFAEADYKSVYLGFDEVYGAENINDRTA